MSHHSDTRSGRAEGGRSSNTWCSRQGQGPCLHACSTDRRGHRGCSRHSSLENRGPSRSRSKADYWDKHRLMSCRCPGRSCTSRSHSRSGWAYLESVRYLCMISLHTWTFPQSEIWRVNLPCWYHGRKPHNAQSRFAENEFRNPPGFLEDFEETNIDCAFYVVSRVIYSYLEKAWSNRLYCTWRCTLHLTRVAEGGAVHVLWDDWFTLQNVELSVEIITEIWYARSLSSDSIHIYSFLF